MYAAKWITNSHPKKCPLPKGNWIKYAFKADALVDADVAKADNQATLLPEDDAATAILGDGWRMPTPEEAQELMDKCEIKYWEQGTNFLGGEEIVYVEQYGRRYDVKAKTVGMEYRYNGLPIRAVKK